MRAWLTAACIWWRWRGGGRPAGLEADHRGRHGPHLRRRRRRGRDRRLVPLERVVRAIIDDAGPAPDLVGVVPAGQEPPIQSGIKPTGGTIIDLGRAEGDGDELPQLFTVGG